MNEQYKFINTINTIVVFVFISHDTVVLFYVHILNKFISVYDKNSSRIPTFFN